MYIYTINQSTTRMSIRKDQYSHGKYTASSQEPAQIGIFTTHTHTFIAFAVHGKRSRRLSKKRNGRLWRSLFRWRRFLSHLHAPLPLDKIRTAKF